MSNGHEYHLYLYNKIKGIPDGVVIKDANDILHKSNIFGFNKKRRQFNHTRLLSRKYAYFSEWFRYVLLYNLGGWWVDMDVVCLKNFNFSQPYVFCGKCFSGDRKDFLKVNNGIIKVPIKSKIMNSCKNKTKNFAIDMEWGMIHPSMIYKELEKFSLVDFVLSSNIFEPNCDGLFEKNINLDYEKIYSVHLGNTGMDHINKNGTFPKDSLIEQLKARYL